ncbi:MAG TPA: type II toxin-antitoxin system RelE/ParE family toxin [Candidatus Binatia bacterium]
MIVFDPDAVTDLERIVEFHAERDPAIALDHVRKIREAILILERHPEIGRIIDRESTLRELIISTGRSGYVTLYEYSEPQQLIRVLAIRRQREAGYRGR